MRYCNSCGKELADDAKFCDACGTAVGIEESADCGVEVAENTSVETAVESAVVDVTNEAVAVDEEQPTNGTKKFRLSKKLLIIAGAALVCLIVAAIAIWNATTLKQYKEKLELAYDCMVYGAEVAEDYASLESKVWRNCIYEEESYETDKYTQNSYGEFYEDFNTALTKFYLGESVDYDIVAENVELVNVYMSELKDYPKKYEDEYKALKELYVAYSDMTELVIGDSSYSWNTFNEALNNARADYKSALSSAKLLIE